MNVLLAAFLGGLVASSAGLFIQSPEALNSSTMRVYPLYFALFLCVFTVPGVLSIASLFQMARSRMPAKQSYLVAISSGAMIGGTVIWIFSSPMSLEAFGLGAYFGGISAAVWAGVNRYVLPAF